MEEKRNLTQLGIEKIDSEEQDYSSSPAEYKILTYPADYTLEVLVSKVHSKEIEIPRFQRGYVWNLYKASRLIESFLSNLPVPPVFLYSESSSKRLLVIDGQQRIKTLLYFFDGFFGEPLKRRRTIFKLSTLHPNSKWYDKSYDELSAKEKRDLKSKVLRAFIVEQLNPKNMTSIYHIFERLNTGGMLLNNQEIRNSLYHGTLNNLMKELNTNIEWRKIVGKKDPDNRQKDVELILRFFALFYGFKSYSKPMKDFMSDFMAANRNPSNKLSSDMKAVFSNTCTSVLRNLGERPFNRGAGLNTAIFDSVFVTIAFHSRHIPRDIKRRYGSLLRNDTYYKLTRDATTDEPVVKRRFQIVEKTLFK